MDKTIIYITDNTLDPEIAELCQKKLLEVAGDMPIISASQKTIDFGKNICLGEIGRSWMSLYKQQLAALKEAKTKYVTIAEHDCLYTEEHMAFIPPTDDTFYYNENCWFMQWGGNHPELTGMFSTFWMQRFALSQLVCNRELHIEAIEERMYLFNQGAKGITNAGEPGVCKDLTLAYKLATSGSHKHLSGYMEKHLTKFNAEAFRTTIPNIDIRHGTNFTGPKRGKNRTFRLEPWGTIDDIKEVCV